MTQAWPADHVERRPVADLIPYARNSRTHSDAQVTQIASSIKEFGFTVPILLDETNGLIAGHGRLLAAKKLGLTDVPVMVAAGWSEAQKRAYVIADNKLALNAAVRKSAKGHWNGDRKQSTIWHIDKPQKSETGHSTQKPFECMKRPIENNSSVGQAIYEPFSGSGTTIIAGEMTGRSVYAIELNPAYVDVAVTRWQQFTGQTATHEETGKTFVEMMAERHPRQSIKTTVQ